MINQTFDRWINHCPGVTTHAVTQSLSVYRSLGGPLFMLHRTYMSLLYTNRTPFPCRAYADIHWNDHHKPSFHEAVEFCKDQPTSPSDHVFMGLRTF